MRSLPTPALPVASRQLSIPFDSGKLRGISPSDRRTALVRLTRLLLEAAGVAAEERDDDER
jgi:hypothetical protein